jgi:hypothetical protein
MTISLQAAVDSSDQKRAVSELDSFLEAFFKRQGFTSHHWEETGRRFWTWDAPKLATGSIPFTTPVRDGRTEPVLLTPARAHVEIPVRMTANRLFFLGNVTVPDGYPITGIPGDRVGRYTVVYADGDRQEVVLRWGQEIARSNMIAVATRIDPRASAADRVITYVKHPTREIHQTLLFPVETKLKEIATVICELDASEAQGMAPPASMHHSGEDTAGGRNRALLLYALTAETAGQVR